MHFVNVGSVNVLFAVSDTCNWVVFREFVYFQQVELQILPPPLQKAACGA